MATKDGGRAMCPVALVGLTLLCSVNWVEAQPISIQLPADTIVVESVGQITLAIQRSGDLASTVSVRYSTVIGTATAPSDFTAVAGRAEFDSGVSVVRISIPITNDEKPEAIEAFRFIIFEPQGGAFLGSPADVRIQIRDDDSGFQFTSASVEVLESSPQVAIRVLRGDDGISATSVGYATSDGTARAGEDYVGAEGRLDFGPGVWEQTLVIPLLNDGRREPTEYFQVTLSNPASGVSLGSIRTVRVDVEDNDPGVRFNQSDYWLSEDGGTVTLVVERGSDATAPITANYVTVDGTAVAGADFSAVSGVLSLAEGEPSQMITVPILNDGLREAEEYFSLTLGEVSAGASLGEPSTAIIRIIDNDPGVRFGQSDYWASEDSGMIAVWVDRGSDVATGPFTVNYATVNGTAVAGTDFSAVSGVLSLAEGEPSQTITVPILNDGLREAEEHFSLTLSEVSTGASLGEPSTAIIRIIDNDPGVRFGQSDYWASEDSGMLTVWVDRGNDVDESPFTVDYGTAEGAARANLDYTATSGTLLFGFGDQSQTITIPILNDGVREPEESFQLRLTRAIDGPAPGEPSTAIIRIIDNDPGAGFTVTNWEVAEAGGSVDLTVLRGNDVDLGPMRVDYVLMDDTAQAGMDYLAGDGRLEFGSGELEKSFTVSVLPDSEWEGDELVRVVLTNHVGSGALSGTPESWVRLLDDDPVSWELVQQGFPEARGLRDPAWGDGRWVIPFDGPGVIGSTNGWDWERAEAPEIMERLAHGVGRFVGVSASGEVYGSTNGMSWESMGAVPGGAWPARMIYGGGQFVLLTAEPKTWVSADGSEWVAGPVPEGVGSVRGLSYGEGRYVMVTDAGQALVSTNGLNWGSAAVTSGGLWAVAYGEGRFVAVGERPGTEGEMERLVAESTDGETWVVEANTNLVSGSELAYGAGRFVLGGGSGIYTLERGETGWEVTQVSVLDTERVRYEGGRFVGTSYERIQTSEDGLAWSAPTANHRYLVYGDGEFVVMSDNSNGWWNWGYAILSSPDGRSWVPRTSGRGGARGLARGEGAYVAAVGPDHLMRSTNLVDWQQLEPGLGNSPGKHRYVNSLTYGVGRFVAVGRRYDEANGEGAGVVWTSEDGTDWEELDLVRPGTMSWVSARRDEVVVRGDDYDRGPVAFSTADGRNWMTMALEEIEPQIAVQGLWPVETGVGSGLVWLSRGDGAWGEYDLPGNSPVMGVAYGPGFLLAVGERGTIWQSSPLVGLEVLGWTAGGELRLGITGPAGASYDLERSADFQHWAWVVNVQTKEVRHEVLLTDAVGGGPSFYRLVMK